MDKIRKDETYPIIMDTLQFRGSPTIQNHCKKETEQSFISKNKHPISQNIQLWDSLFIARRCGRGFLQCNAGLSCSTKDHGWTNVMPAHSPFRFFPFFAAFAATCSENTFKRFISFSYCAVSICEYRIGNLNAFVSFLSRL